MKLVGKTALFDLNNGTYAFSNHLTRFRVVSEVIEPKWLWYVFATLWRERYFETRCKQWVNQATIRRQTLLEAPVPLPPINEQRRIITKIEALFAQSRRARDALDAVPELLAQFRQAVLAAAFRGELTERDPDDEPAAALLERIRAERRRWEADLRAKGKDPARYKYKESEPPDTSKLPELPEGWMWVTLDQSFKLDRGRFSIRPRNDPRYYDGPYPFVQIGNLPKDGGEITEFTQTLNEKGLGVSRMFPQGTVLIAIVGATIANTGILTFDGCCPDSLVAIQADDEIRLRFVEFYLKFKKYTIREQSYASGAG